MNRSSELKRKTPLKSQGFARSDRIEAREVSKLQRQVEPKPLRGPRQRKCAICRELFAPRSMTHKACKPECAEEVAKQVAAKQRVKAEKVERAEVRRLKEEQKGIKYHLKKTEALVNLFVRLRDKLDGCISCHMPSHYDGIWHASHFKSVGSNSALRFNTWNIHKACEQCNRFKAGNIAEYEKRLVLKIGAVRVEWLKNHERVRKFDVEWLMRLAAIMRRKIKRLEKKAA
jgi:hypothetical protein